MVGSAQRVVVVRARALRDAAVQHCLEYLGSSHPDLDCTVVIIIILIKLGYYVDSRRMDIYFFLPSGHGLDFGISTLCESSKGKIKTLSSVSSRGRGQSAQ